ncbi:germinal-center associated nuclear protein, partial [Geospiza fortis]|uniref:Germinal-center associated nuclear protein n=1 Tax=Geospiza fortis TaxID=48883 RepID=A0A8N5I4R5_GEOFO
ARRSRGSESTEGLGVLPAAELTTVQCKNIPDYLNDRTVLEKHFGQFAKVRRIMTRRNKKMAVLHFFDHASAVLARKKAKELHKDIVTFWQKKKTSPAKREFSSREKKAGEDEGRQSSEEQSYQHSPLRKPLIRSSASSVMPGRSSPAKKPGLRKALQFEAELFDSSSEGQSSEGLGASLSSLSNLVGLVAETSEERYRLLDQRDKIMRQARIKRTDLGKAKTVVGTCPDMCPEKERYMRETRNQLSIFELLLGTDKVDHAAAIKEYSRSSADQEEPLPHELRPSEVLSMTMDYLVTNIMDQGEGNYGEWYDFVWNRTRGIRKVSTVDGGVWGYVELNRSAFLEPDGLPKPRKSLFVSQKLTVSVGEVVNGGPLPPVPHHVPVSSFNGQNKYIGGSTSVDQAGSSQKASVEATEGRVESRGVDLEATAVRVQSPSHLLPSLLPRQLVPVLPSAQPISQPAAQPEPPPSKPQPGYSDEDIAEVVDGLVHDVLKGECREVGRAGAAYVAAAICASEATIEELVTEVMEEILREVAGNMLSVERQRVQEERRRVEEERQKREREELIKQLSQLLGMELMEEVIKESVKEASVSELRCALERDRQARIARCSEEVCGHFMELFLEDEIFQIAKETLQELQCFCKYLKRWREAVVARTKLKRQMRAFPAAPCGLDSKHQLKALSPSAEWPIAMENLCKRFVNLGNGGKLGISCTRLNLLRNKTVHEIKVQHFYQQLVSDLAWTPLDLVSLIAEHIPVQQEQVFWKALLVLPSDDEYSKDDPNRILMDWLKAKFMGHRNHEKNASHTEGKIQTLTLFSSPGMQGTRSIKVSVCIKVAHGALSDSELDLAETQKDLLGTSGLILLLPPRVSSEDVAEDDVYWLSALLQLKQLLQAKPFHPIVPLVVLVPSQKEEAAEKEVEDGLMLQDLISAHLISDYTVVELPGSVNDLEGTRRVSAAVGWLVSQCPASLELCSQTLQEYIEDGIDGEFGKRFYHDWKERRLAGLPSQEPGAIIELYNSVLQFLSDVASSEHFCDLSWPVTEFSEAGGNKVLPHLQWNMPDHLAWLKKAVLSFQIPYLDLPPLGAPWHPVCHMIFQYVSQIASSSHTQPLIQSQVENMLSKTYQNWKTRATGNSGEDGPSVDEIPWDCILAVCIDHKLRDWKPPKLPVAPEAVSKDGQIRVYFFKEHLKNYTVPFSWDQARLRTQEEIRQGHERSKIKSPKFSKKPHSISMVPGQYGSGMSMLPVQEVSIPSTDEFRDTSLAQERLLAQLQLEKLENKRFEEQLHQYLAEDIEPLGDLLGLPLYLPQSLLSTPAATCPLVKSPMSAAQEAGSQEGHKVPELEQSSALSDRLKHLQQLLRATKEAEAASELHLSALVDMVDI